MAWHVSLYKYSYQSPSLARVTSSVFLFLWTGIFLVIFMVMRVFTFQYYLSLAGPHQAVSPSWYLAMKTITLTLVLLHLLSISCTPQYQWAQSFIPPADDIPDLKDCSPEAPCQYGEGDCTPHGDDGCDSDLVCGVNNCGDFVPGMAGSCCAQLAGPSEFLEEKAPIQWTSWSATWGGWGRTRGRALIASNGTLYYQYEKQSLE